MKKRLTVLFIIWFVVILAFIAFVFLTKKGHDLREQLAATILSTQHRDWAKYTFLSKEDLAELQKQISQPDYVNSYDPNSVDKMIKQIKERNGQIGEEKKAEEEKKKLEERNKKLIVEIKTVEKRFGDHYYKGSMMTINNPLNLKIVNSQYDNRGEQISSIAKRTDAVAATNASGFVDPGGNGYGGDPIGIIITKGEVTNTRGGMNGKDYVAGLTKDGVLVTGYYTPNELLNLNVYYAAGFKPQLIVNGKKMITQGDGGWGYGPRTAIGQKKDGSIVLVVIDGRQAHSIGASIKDVQDLLYDEGVINAICMDGGSSSSMYVKNKGLITIPSAYAHMERYIPNAWVVVPNEGQSVSVTIDGKKVDE